MLRYAGPGACPALSISVHAEQTPGPSQLIADLVCADTHRYVHGEGVDASAAGILSFSSSSSPHAAMILLSLFPDTFPSGIAAHQIDTFGMPHLGSAECFCVHRCARCMQREWKKCKILIEDDAGAEQRRTDKRLRTC